MTIAAGGLASLIAVKATASVEFSFDSTMYTQVDGVAIGSPLRATLGDLFVSFQKSQMKIE